jgi:hypothetical protein
VLNCHAVTCEGRDSNPHPDYPEEILSPPATFRNSTSYPVIHGEASLGFVRVGAFRDIRFCYQNRYQPTFHVAHLKLISAAPAAGPLVGGR